MIWKNTENRSYALFRSGDEIFYSKPTCTRVSSSRDVFTVNEHVIIADESNNVNVNKDKVGRSS